MCSNGLLKKTEKKEKTPTPTVKHAPNPPKVDLAFPAKGPKSQTPQVVWLGENAKKMAAAEPMRKKKSRESN